VPLSPGALEEFLAEPRLVHFATVDANGRPRVRPLWYLWRDGAFYFTTRTKVRNTGRDLQASRRVAISIASDHRPYRAVLAWGNVQEVGKDRELLRAIATRYGEREGLAWLRHALTQPDRTVVKLVPDPLLSWDYGAGDARKQDQGVSMRTEL
jgi:nitroimidazol reductase NimA-like FMN-containing flavoprotein (pyridoxamine 5'-phosphate oxidase superfamily)